MAHPWSLLLPAVLATVSNSVERGPTEPRGSLLSTFGNESRYWTFVRNKYEITLTAKSGAMPERPYLPKTAYFSMEIAIDPSIPTYSGGLGVLAGDTLRAAADLGFPMVAMTLLYRKGYFRQSLSPTGVQTESPEQWDPARQLQRIDKATTVSIEGRQVRIAAWRFEIKGVSGYSLPVYLLDSDFPENCPQDRELTSSLYGSDEGYRLRQEMILGIGGFNLLEESVTQVSFTT